MQRLFLFEHSVKRLHKRLQTVAELSVKATEHSFERFNGYPHGVAHLYAYLLAAAVLLCCLYGKHVGKVVDEFPCFNANYHIVNLPYRVVKFGCEVVPALLRSVFRVPLLGDVADASDKCVELRLAHLLREYWRQLSADVFHK